MYKVLIVSLLVFLFVGCNEPGQISKFKINQELRREIFKECMQLLPAGPQETKYNDWDEVVEECDNVAYSQSRYCYSGCDN